jgi:hypothetical protein
MAILNGLGFIMFPLAEFASGQIYNVGGYYAVYATSLGATLAGFDFRLLRFPSHFPFN